MSKIKGLICYSIFISSIAVLLVRYLNTDDCYIATVYDKNEVTETLFNINTRFTITWPLLKVIKYDDLSREIISHTIMENKQVIEYVNLQKGDVVKVCADNAGRTNQLVKLISI